MKTTKIRYSYKPVKVGVQLGKIRCPICKNPINWIKPVGDYEYSNRIVLLAECWSGNTSIKKPEHLFLIKIEDLPMIKIKKVVKT